MKKSKLISLVIAAVIILSFTVTTRVSAEGEVQDLVIKYGTTTITAKLLEDFATSEVEQETVWHEGTVDMKNGKIFYEGINIADAYVISVPKAQENKELYQKAKYWGFELKNDCDGDIYYCFQTKFASFDIFMSPQGSDPIILVDKNGVTYDIIFSDSASLYSRYGIIIPEGFDGYVIFPTSRLTRLNDWGNTAWTETTELRGIGAHVSIGQSASPAVDASFIEFYIDNFFVFNGEFPAYEAPVTPEPTASPTPSPTPEPTPTPVKTAAKTTAPADEEDESDGFNALPFIVGGAAAVVIAGAVVIALKAKKKK